MPHQYRRLGHVRRDLSHVDTKVSVGIVNGLTTIHRISWDNLILLSDLGNSNCRQSEILIVALHQPCIPGDEHGEDPQR